MSKVDHQNVLNKFFINCFGISEKPSIHYSYKYQDFVYITVNVALGPHFPHLMSLGFSCLWRYAKCHY